MVAEVKTPDRMWYIAWSHNSSLAALGIAFQNELYIYDAQSWTVVTRLPMGEWVQGASWSRDDAMLAYFAIESSPGHGLSGEAGRSLNRSAARFRYATTPFISATG